MDLWTCLGILVACGHDVEFFHVGYCCNCLCIGMNLEIECMVVMDMVYGYVKGIWKLNICMELLFYE